MKISGFYTLPVARERAYQNLQDPAILAQAMPGCQSLEKIGPDEYRLKMKVLLAALSGQFEGRVRITDQSPPNGFRLIVEGSGRIGFLKGEGLLKLAPVEASTVIPSEARNPSSATAASTVVSYEGDVQVGGTMAAVGQRLIDGTAKMMIKKFFDKLASLTP
ncbi:MAG TPA: carbon monoxide dehydrogenase subunit G [Candidatus Dormibacteraeota bacterium]|nr:carbon monoxide dehydrogenase subunit G [Candidatus Dormibacteraeota bacterium]